MLVTTWSVGQEMMEVRSWGESLLRLYLEDLSQGIDARMTNTSLREAHRALIAFRIRALAGLDGEERRAAAERLCVLRGYAAASVGEENDAGEDALVRAAADGAVGVVGVRLLMDAGAISGGEALIAAAKYGQWEAVVALIGAGIPVDSKAVKVRLALTAKEVAYGMLFLFLSLADAVGAILRQALRRSLCLLHHVLSKKFRLTF